MAEYIEREAILNRLNKVHMDNRPFDAGVQFGVDHAISCVIEAPSADVAPVVHCKFVKSEYHDDRLVCTACGFDNKGWLRFCNYCPNCGAKKDGGESDA